MSLLLVSLLIVRSILVLNNSEFLIVRSNGILECIFAGVGGIEAEAVMLGQAISMVLPKVVGYKLTGQVRPFITSTDVVLTITKVKLKSLLVRFKSNCVIRIFLKFCHRVGNLILIALATA